MEKKTGADIALSILKYTGIAVLCVIGFPVLLIAQLLKISD